MACYVHDCHVMLLPLLAGLPFILILLDLVQLLTRLHENGWVQNSSVPFVLELHIDALG